MSVVHEIIAPKENADDALLVRKLYFKNKDKVLKHDELLDLETSKIVITLDSDVEGYVEYLVRPGTSVWVGEVIIRIHDNPDSIGEKVSSTTQSGDASLIPKVISRNAQKYIQKNNIDISSLQKSFIKLSDVTGKTSDKSIKTRKLPDNAILASLNSETEVKEISLSLAKKTEIAALSNIQNSGLVSTIFYNVDDCYFPDSENLIFNSTGSSLPIISYEVAQLLKSYPMLNSYYEDDMVMEYVNINLGIALDIDDGLQVYTIKNCDDLDFKLVKIEISQAIYSYLRKNLTREQVTGSTFTITDLSSLGVDRFIPLINYKQSAILGVSALDKKLNRFTLSLSFDHRVTEGKVASNFLSELTENLKNHIVK